LLPLFRFLFSTKAFCVALSWWLVALSWESISAQVPAHIPSDTVTPKATIDTLPAQVPQRDLMDVLATIIKKRKPASARDTIADIRKPTFSILPAVGYTLTTKTAVTVTGNAAFRTNADANISTITASAAYTQNKQFTVPLETNIWTRANTYNFVGDIHFMKYPQDTYGLGSNSPIENVDPMDYNYIRFYEIVYRKVASNFFLGAGYILDWRYNIKESGPPLPYITDYEKYGPATRSTSTGFTLNGLYDTRDNSINPYRGFYAEVTYRNNQKFMGSNTDWQSTIIDVRKYVRFPEGSKNILAFWSYDWLILNGKPPYLDLPSTNWDRYSSTGRGYIQGRFRGREMVYLESEYRFGLTANGLFGAVVFLNGESFSSGLTSNKLQSVQPGFGAGLRIKLNKTSRTNLDIDYGFGAQGSNGLFVNIAELF
jgi:hypothetical protein